MIRIGLQMLMGETGKFVGMLLGIVFSSFVITQQMSIFVGLMTRTYGFISDTALPDLWVADSKIQFVDDIKPLQDTQLYRVRGVDGVDWAVPMYKGILRARLADGTFQNTIVVGLDDATLIGGPPEMVEGRLEDLRRADGVIVDIVGATGRLARPPANPSDPEAKPVPLKVGDTLELNDRRAVVVGLARVSRTFQSQPVIYTTYSRATAFAPQERKLLSFVLVKAKPGVQPEDLAARIRREIGLGAWTRPEFKDLTFLYFMKNTGIPINFGIAVVLGLVVGTAIAGQTFYTFTQDNLRYLATLKAMGAGTLLLVKMVVVQALTVGFFGYGIGVFFASLFYYVSKKSELAFRLPVGLLIGTGAAVLIICMLSALLSIVKVIRLDPAIVFK